MKVAVVGGGPNGVITAGELIRQIPDVEIHMYGDGKWGHGTVYGKRELRSSRQSFMTKEMGVDPNDPGAVANWANDTTPEGFASEDLKPDAFPPRKLVGLYFEDRIKQVRKQARAAGAALQLRQERVLDIDGDRVSTRHNHEQGFEAIFLCLGNFPSSVGREFRGLPGYHPEVWGKDMFDFPSGDDVLVLGSGLSSIDVLFALHERGHEGRVRFGSRNGLLPSVRAEIRNVDVSALLDDFRFSDGSFDAFKAVTSRYFTWEKGVLPQSYVRCLADYMPGIWSRFSVADRKRFDKDLGALWNALHLPMSVEASQLIDDLGDRFKAGVISETGFNGDCWHAEINGTVETFDQVINATGRNLNVETIEDPLVRSLLARETLRPHPCGGFNVNFVDSSAGKIRVIGPLARGVRFYTYTIEQNALQIRDAVTSLTDRTFRRHAEQTFSWHEDGGPTCG